MVKKTFDVSRAITALAAGGFIIEDGSIRHIEGHDLPTAEDILEAVHSRPEEIAADLLSVIADTGLPTIPDAPDSALCLRVCAGRGTAEDVAMLSRIIAAGEAEVSDRGYTALWEEKEPEEKSTPESGDLSDVAYIVANELHIRDALLDFADDVIDRINDRKSTKEDVRALVKALVKSILVE